MSSNENEKCDCNKNRCLMNDVNWTRHLNACPVRKAKRKNQTIKNFFTLPQSKKICKDFTRISECKLPTLLFLLFYYIIFITNNIKQIFYLRKVIQTAILWKLRV